jgi:hypothetical protein
MDARRLVGLICALFAPATGLADANPGQGVLTDAALTAYAAASYDKAAMMAQHVQLGRHHGVAVVADFPCSDVCPAYTVRIIHYAVAPGPACAAAGGVSEMREVPFSIATREEAFCLPAVLAGGGGR